MAYESWSKEDLIARLTLLEVEKEPQPTPRIAITPPPPNPRRLWRTFDFSSYPRRKIALKFCYSGWAYNGLAIQADITPLPTVEGVIFDALAKARLIDPDAGLEGCGWERCGRTDRGVSAGGQVISLWVRSALNNASIPADPSPDASFTENAPPEPSPEDLSGEPVDSDAFPALDDGDFGSLDGMDFPLPTTKAPRKSELSYTLILNRILPPTIRILAWSPVAPEFSARFNCKSRHYKYFFSPDNLDISRMREAAALLVGLHDFRNFCKLDPAKQLTTYIRRVMRADISPVVAGVDAGMHVLDLEGSAFLYHQVRHIMAVLFLVGSGLEPPSVVTSLLNVAPGAEGDDALPVVDTRPEYQMADALPLMLYACHFGENELKWEADEDAADEDADGLFFQLHAIRARSELYATLNAEFLRAAAAHHSPPPARLPITATGFVPDGRTPMNVPLGGAEFRRTAKYVGLLERKRGGSILRWKRKYKIKQGILDIRTRLIVHRLPGVALNVWPELGAQKRHCDNRRKDFFRNIECSACLVGGYIELHSGQDSLRETAVEGLQTRKHL
ncbi:tRNA pseudouridine synthase [Mycena venus]|uniref:tRNA pseudouridine synthase n=1 Tax=Mycena venus TaxID=2733690 RepID=A0A8H6XQW1_9AGAR|nr:tRNA pseudouridine synthase [Mycena venus]